MMMEDRCACPACGWSGSQLNPQRVGRHHRTGHNWQVVCNRCRARGPLCKTMELAEAGWNKMARPVEPDEYRPQNIELALKEAIAAEKRSAWRERREALDRALDWVRRG